MKLPSNPSLPTVPVALLSLLRDITKQVNAVTEGQGFAFHNAATAAPTTGTYAQGDFIRNSAPVEAGAVSSKYVVLGWVCVVAGTPGTWVDVRALTGN